MSTNRNELSQKKCKACTPETPPLQGEALHNYYQQLSEGWNLVDQHHLEKTWRFKNFREALDLTIGLGEMSEEEGHHPDIHLSWGKVRVVVYTHAIDALSESDFIWAAKAESVYEERQK